MNNDLSRDSERPKPKQWREAYLGKILYLRKELWLKWMALYYKSSSAVGYSFFD